MLGSWFANVPGENRQRSSFDDALAANAGAQPILDEDEKSPKRAATTAIVTPHDAVLAELQEHNPTINLSARIEDQSVPDLRSPKFQNQDGTHQQSETLYDPWDGAPITSMTKASQLEFPDICAGKGLSRNEDFWTHLSKVLELQDGIAKLHVDMEEIGVKNTDPRASGSRRPMKTFPNWDFVGGKSSAGSRNAEAGIDSHPREGSFPDRGSDEDEEVGVNVEEDEEAARNRARETEFANLANKFEGRRAKIDEIMEKLDNLSEALTEFHTLHTPEFITFPISTGSSPQHSKGGQIQATSPPSPPPASKRNADVESSLPPYQEWHALQPPRLSFKARQPETAFPSNRHPTYIDNAPLRRNTSNRHHPEITESPKSIGSLLPADDN